MLLDEFNSLSAEAAEAAVRPCVGIESFVAAVVGGRPYPDLEALLATAAAQSDTWTDAEVEAALADHPRIGERHQAPGTSSAEHSRSEQAGVDPADADVRARLRAANEAYEQRFGRIYLVRAKGRSAEQLLAMLHERLGNDPDTERTVTKEQLGEIALLRLEDLVTTAGPEAGTDAGHIAGPIAGPGEGTA